MALRGRKPTPVETKRIMGNPGGRPLTTVVPKARKGIIPLPPEVEEDPIALAAWQHYTTTTDPGHLMPVDGPMLAELCMVISALKRNRAFLAKTGEMLKSKETGAWYQSPFLSVVRHQREAMIKLCGQLSLSVAERNRVGIHDADEEDPTSHFFDA
jgi:phage terminase small subunit